MWIREMSTSGVTVRRIAWRLALTGIVGMLALIVGAFSTVGASIAYAQGATGKTAIGSDLRIQRGEVVEGNVTVTDGNAIVDGEVRGNVVVVNGNALINGKVGGDVSAANGDATLGPSSEVGGNVLVFAGGRINRQSGAKVRGETSIVAMPIPGMNSMMGEGGPNRSGSAASQAFAQGLAGSVMRIGGLIAWLGLSVLLLLAVLGFALIVPQRLLVSSGTLDAAPGHSVAVGLIGAFLLGPVTGILMMALAITVVGIALIPVLGIVLALALLFGLANISVWLGRRVHDSVRHGQHGQYIGLQGPQRVLLEASLGVGVILCAALFPTLALPGWIGLLLWSLVYFAACIGLAAGVMSRFGTLAPPVKQPTTA